MRSKVYTIGRSEECDIIIDDPSNITSGKHAVFRIDRNGRYFITDCSTNGTYVNGMKIQPNVAVSVSRGDSISFAHMVDFDWTLIPNETKKNLVILLSVIAGVAVVCLAVFAALRFSPGHTDTDDYPGGFSTPVAVSPVQIPGTRLVRDRDTLKSTGISPDGEKSSGIRSRAVRGNASSETESAVEQPAAAEEQPSGTTIQAPEKKKITNPLI
jgi:hypothetical protein